MKITKSVKIIYLLLALVFFPVFGEAQDLLIKNGILLTITQGIIQDGDILIIDGKIKKIGKALPVPEGVQVVDVSGKYVMPGIIDSHTHIALAGTNESSVAISSQVDMRDVLNAEDTSIFAALSGGVTMVHTMHGSANPIGGENITLKMKWGKTAEEIIVPQAQRTLKFALGENPKRANFISMGKPRYPQTRMGVKAIIRRELEKAKNYMNEWDRFYKVKKGKKQTAFILPPRKDLGLERLADLLKGKIWARCHTYRADETLEFIALSKEFGFKIACFEHASEAFKIVKELAAENIGLSIFADNWAYKVEASEGIAYNAAYCTKNGILVSINSDSGERIRRLFNDAAKAMKYGDLSEEESLKLVTINPAIQLGVDKLVGSLEEGKDGDLAVFNEHPLSAYTRCDMTIIEGQIYFDRAQYLKERMEVEKEKKEQKNEEKKGGINE